MKAPTRTGFAQLAARASVMALGVGAIVGGVAACNVEVLPDASRPAIVNSCTADKDCGNGVCSNGECYARSGNFDEVLLKIVPEAASPFAGITFLSMQQGLRRGDRARAIALVGPVPFTVQVQVNGEDLPADCPYLHNGKQTIAARVQFDRVGGVGGVSVTGVSNGPPVIVDTEQNTSTSTSGFSKNISLIPGFYDIYAQPVVSTNCQIAPKIWRGVEVNRDGQVVAWAPPATLDLATPLRLNGRVTRNGETLKDWQIEVIDPRDEKVISTSRRLGATTDTSPFTNFEIAFQPIEEVVNPNASPARSTGGVSPLIRMKPPKDAASTVPTVFFELSAAGATGGGEVNLELSSLPTSSQLVTVAGQVRGKNSGGVRATVKFHSTFRALIAAYSPTVTTDESGRYSIKLFPGSYRIVVVPDGATDNGTVVASANTARTWALTEQEGTIGADASQTLDLTVTPIRTIEGTATAGAGHSVAQGATLEAAPLIASSSDVLRTLLRPVIAPAPASVPVNDESGKFSLAVDPGYYDLTLKPADTSHFAWWILPAVHVLTPDMAGPVATINPELLYPVPLSGTITVMQDKTSQPLRNATVQAYAPTPEGGVTQVGIARTDDMGRYRLALPPAFGSLP